MAGLEDRQVVTLEQLNHCCKLARNTVAASEKTAKNSDFLSRVCSQLGKLCEVKGEYSSAEELYSFSIDLAVRGKALGGKIQVGRHSNQSIE